MREYESMIALLSDQVVAYRPAMARALGGVTCALFFQQIAFQAKDLIPEEAGYSAWVYKTRTKMERETAMRRYEQETARRKLRELDVMEEELRGVPARMHYRIYWPIVFELLQAVSDGGNPTNLPVGVQPTSRGEFNNLDGGDPANSEDGSQPTKRGREKELDIDVERDAKIAREEYQDQLDFLSALDHETYQKFLGRDLSAGEGDTLIRFHLAETGDLFIYERGGFAPEHRRLIGTPPRDNDRRSKRRR